MLVHAILHWPQEMNLDLWPFAMEHEIYLWNHQLNRAPGILPVKLSTGQIFENYDFLNTLGCRSLCPVVYGVLDPTLHNSKKTPKWVPCWTCRGQ
jgi:hypothetical protein